MFTEIGIPLIIGLAIFLFGMKIMELALHYWAGAYLQNLLKQFTQTPLRGMITGAGLTAVLQSSSAITVITIGLVNAGMLTFPRTLGIILGTNIGTVITTELIGLNISHLSIPLLISSAVIFLLTWLYPTKFLEHKNTLYRWIHGVRYLSMAAGGFACVFIGMDVMHTIVPALQSRGLLAWFVEQSQRSLLWGILAGACLTAVIQSSAATIAMTMGLASVQAISVDLGVAIILGANIGTCATGLIASIGGTRSGQLVAWSHVALNVGGAILFYPLIPLLYEISASLSSTPSGQLAHAQTIFNILCSLIALPICYLQVFRRMRVR
jgi:phosphate:Na+ symporter